MSTNPPQADVLAAGSIFYHVLQGLATGRFVPRINATAITDLTSFDKRDNQSGTLIYTFIGGEQTGLAAIMPLNDHPGCYAVCLRPGDQFDDDTFQYITESSDIPDPDLWKPFNAFGEIPPNALSVLKSMLTPASKPNAVHEIQNLLVSKFG